MAYNCTPGSAQGGPTKIPLRTATFTNGMVVIPVPGGGGGSVRPTSGQTWPRTR